MTNSTPTTPISRTPSTDGRPLERGARQAPQPPYRLLRADDARLREAVYHLRYRAYRSVDAIPPNARQRFVDDHDAMPSSMSYLLMDRHGVLGAVRASVRSPSISGSSLPCAAAFSDVLDEELGRGATIVESSRFVTDPDVPERSLEPLVALFKAIAANAIAHDADAVVTAVRRKHVLFYRRMMGFRRISKERLYPGLSARMMLLATDPRVEYPKAAERMPAMAMTPQEAHEVAL